MSDATDGATKQKALQLAREKGPAQAARELGIPAGTIRSWRQRAGESGPPAGTDPDDWATGKRQDSEEATKTARLAMRKVKSLISEGKTLDAQRAALTCAILTDKAGVLETAAANAEAQQVRITEAQVEHISGAIDRLFDELHLSFPKGGTAKQVLGWILRHGDGQAPQAERARTEIREAIRQELLPAIREEVRLEMEREAETRMLPAGDPQPGLPAPTGEETKTEPMTGPVRRVRAAPDAPDDEVLDGEVVEESGDVDSRGRRRNVAAPPERFAKTQRGAIWSSGRGTAA